MGLSDRKIKKAGDCPPLIVNRITKKRYGSGTAIACRPATRATTGRRAKIDSAIYLETIIAEINHNGLGFFHKICIYNVFEPFNVKYLI